MPLQTTRWAVKMTAEFESHDYPVSEQSTAERQADLLRRAALRGNHDVNCSRPTVRVDVIEKKETT